MSTEIRNHLTKQLEKSGERFLEAGVGGSIPIRVLKTTSLDGSFHFLTGVSDEVVQPSVDLFSVCA